MDGVMEDGVMDRDTDGHDLCMRFDPFMDQPDLNEEGKDAIFPEYEPIEVYIRDMPVNLICTEKCDNTLHYLLSTRSLCEEEIQSLLLQVMFTLDTYQKRYKFVHNDLHTCNIMYSSTDQTHLEYIFEGETFRVPTFGRIYKIIDFGRAIFVVDGVQFCSDSFSPFGDACGQYNCPPFYDDGKPAILPNFSFDLCFFAVGMYLVGDIHGREHTELSPSAQTIRSWCMDDAGRNIAFTRTGEERYPGFKLYKMITRHVTKHVPATELKTISWVQNYRIHAANEHQAI